MQDSTDLPWSVTGHLQTNEAELVARSASEFQALDSLRVTEALEHRLQQEGRPLNVFVPHRRGGTASYVSAPGHLPALPDAHYWPTAAS